MLEAYNSSALFLYNSIALLVLRQQCVDRDSLLSPALQKHKDFSPPGHKMSQKMRKIRGRTSLNETYAEQVCLLRLVPCYMNYFDRCQIKIPPLWRHFCTPVIAQDPKKFSGHLVQRTWGNMGYCLILELPFGWRLMERYEKQTKESWQAENYSWMGRGCRSTHSCLTSYFRASQTNTSIQQVVRPAMNCVSGSPGFTGLNWWTKLKFN